MHPDAKKALATNHRLDNFKKIVQDAKSKGLVRGPGDKAPVKTGSAPNGAATEMVYGNIRASIREITPHQARVWLNGNNRGNRALRGPTVDAYARDMANGDWLLNHQGIAFNDEDVLIDGQHRLAAIAQSGVTLPLLVTTGWPSAGRTRAKIMDTVDRGAARSIADLLNLQHGIEHPRFLVMAAANIARACIAQPKQAAKLTVPLALGVIEAFRDGLRFAVANRPTTIGLRQANVLGAVALAYGAHPKEVPEFLGRLVTGENLSRDNPILPLRNYLLSDLSRRAATTNKVGALADVLNHLHLFITGRKAERLTSSLEGLIYFKSRQPEAVEKVRKLFPDAVTPKH